MLGYYIGYFAGCSLGETVRLTLMRLSCSLLLVMGLCPPAIAEEVDFTTQASGLAKKIESALEKLFPEFEREVIPGTKISLKREFKVTDFFYDTEQNQIHLRARVRYYTPNAAVVNMVGLGISETISLDTKYNISVSEFTKLDVKFQLPKNWGNIDIKLTKLKEVLDGNIAAAFELIPNGGLVKRKSSSEYDARKKAFQEKYGTDNVYFASSDFVRWASPETAGRWVVTLIASGGSSTTAIGAEVREQVSKEFAHIVAFLKKKSVRDAESMALDFVSGKPITLPNLKLVWQHVKYKSQVEIAGRSLPEIELNHAAFVLVFETPTKPGATFEASAAQLADDNEFRPKWRIGARYALGPTGCRIVFLAAGGPIDKAGVKVDEVITKINDVSVSVPDYRSNSLIRQLKSVRGPTAKFEILSSTTGMRTVTVHLDPIQ